MYRLSPALVLHLEPKSRCPGSRDSLSRLAKRSRELLKAIVEAEKCRTQQEGRRHRVLALCSLEPDEACKDKRGGFRFFNLRVAPTAVSSAAGRSAESPSPVKSPGLDTEAHVCKRSCLRVLDTATTEKRPKQGARVGGTVEVSETMDHSTTETVRLHLETGAEAQLNSRKDKEDEEVGRLENAGERTRSRNGTPAVNDSFEMNGSERKKGEELENNEKVFTLLQRSEDAEDVSVPRGPLGDHGYILTLHRAAGDTDNHKVEKARRGSAVTERAVPKAHLRKAGMQETALEKPAYWLPAVPQNVDLTDFLKKYSD